MWFGWWMHVHQTIKQFVVCVIGWLSRIINEALLPILSSKLYSYEQTGWTLSLVAVGNKLSSHHHHHWHNSPFWAKAFFRSYCQLSFWQSGHCFFGFRNNIFSGAGCQPCVQPPAILEDQLDCFLVWVFVMDQSGMGGPTSSFATASIAPWLIRPHKPHHPHQGVAIPNFQVHCRIHNQRHQMFRKVKR